MAYQKKITVVEFQKCIECGEKFELTSNRKRKYCSVRCGHNATAREWMQRMRRKK